MDKSIGLERIRMLAEDLVMTASAPTSPLSQQELLQCLANLTRVIHTLTDADQTITQEQLSYIETKFYAAYNTVTGKVVYPW